MFSSTLKVIGCLFAVCLVVNAQNPVKKTQTASISGKVTMKGNGLAGVVVAARLQNSNGRRNSTVTATTDQQGNYRLSNVAPGEYEMGPAAPNFVVVGYQSLKRLIVAEGENLEGVDFALIRGGAITGKVTDAEGKPLIEERIDVMGPEGSKTQMTVRVNLMNRGTDDRGVYRIYGLAPGKYKVSAGLPEDQLQFGGLARSLYTQTFYPSTIDVAKAAVVEVTEGGETTNVDITLRKAQSTFTVTARIVDADTGKPVPNVRVGLQKFRENGSMGTSGPTANAVGEFKLENITPGKYALYVDPSGLPGGSHYAEPVWFEVVDQDITDLVVKASTSGSVSGVVVLDGMDEKTRRSINALMIVAHVSAEDPRGIGFGSTSHSHVNADGSFTLGGLRPGTLIFSIFPASGLPASELEVTRIERDGQVQSRIEVKERDQIKGLRLFVKSRSGKIRGVVKFENGQLPSTAFVHAHISKVGEDNGASLQIDDRGRFVSPGLTAGVYEISIVVYTARRNQPPPTAKQQVVVADNQITEVTITVDLKQ